MEETIKTFLQERLRASIDSTPLDLDTPLFSSGIVDSFGVLELIAFLDDTFRVDINPGLHELTEFDTIAKIAVLVTLLQQRKARP